MSTSTISKMDNKLQNLNLLEKNNGQVVAFTIPKEQVSIIERYHYGVAAKGLKSFAQSTVNSIVSWMNRMIGGSELFELETLEHWKYDASGDYLSLNTGRDVKVKIDMSFTSDPIDSYNQQLGEILSSHWYKTYALPTAIIEFIAAADLLYRERHEGISPSAACVE